MNMDAAITGTDSFAITAMVGGTGAGDRSKIDSATARLLEGERRIPWLNRKSRTN
jgi:hypothetical protein